MKNTNETDSHLRTALNDKKLIDRAFEKNIILRLGLEYSLIKSQVVKAYQNLT